MLKRIVPGEVRVGMYIDRFEGAWLDHPFWKSRFLVKTAAEVQKVATSAVPALWIDTARGEDVVTAPASEAPARAPTPSSVDARPSDAALTPTLNPADPLFGDPFASPSQAARPTLPTRTLQEELADATRICGQGREQVTSMFAEARMGKAVDGEACLPLVNEITDSVFRNPEALISLTRLKTKDDYTYMHSVAVCALMVGLGRSLGLSDEDCRNAGLAGLLHDIGKAMMPLEILMKPGKLTDAEFDIMKRHPAEGADLLREKGAVPPSAIEVCLHHHEKFDGSGYPERLAGENITVLSRMAALCDVYDAVTSERPYKKAWDPADALSRMASWTGHFDPAMQTAFVKNLGIYPTGALVKLKSRRLAVVAEQNFEFPTRPVVTAFYSYAEQSRIPPVRLNLMDVDDPILERAADVNVDRLKLSLLWRQPA